MGLLFSRVVALQLHCERPTKSEAGVKIIPKQISAFQMHRSSRSFHCFLPLDRSFFVYDCILSDNCQECRLANTTTAAAVCSSNIGSEQCSAEENAASPISFESEDVGGRNGSGEGVALHRFSSAALKSARARRWTCMLFPVPRLDEMPSALRLLARPKGSFRILNRLSSLASTASKSWKSNLSIQWRLAPTLEVSLNPWIVHHPRDARQVGDGIIYCLCSSISSCALGCRTGQLLSNPCYVLRSRQFAGVHSCREKCHRREAGGRLGRMWEHGIRNGLVEMQSTRSLRSYLNEAPGVENFASCFVKGDVEGKSSLLCLVSKSW